MSTVHLTHCDLLLSRWHGTHAKRLGANGAGADHPWQRHRAVLHPADTVKLLLEDGGPASMPTGRRLLWNLNVVIPHPRNNEHVCETINAS